MPPPRCRTSPWPAPPARWRAWAAELRTRFRAHFWVDGVHGRIPALALDAASPWRGALLAVAYAAGLGIPFLLVVAGLGRGSRTVGWIRAHRLAVARTGGGVLLTVGLLLVTGVWSTWLYRLMPTITSVTLPV